VLRLHDTATGRVAELVPRDPDAIGLYVCGPTVYGPPHVGHGRFALVYDVLRRYLEYRGFSVTHVSNVTDIDDKIIDRANREGRAWDEVAAECEEQWWQAMDAMGIARPTFTPHATDYLAEMVDLIAALVARKAAYETNDGVYLAVQGIPDYGLLKHQDLDSLLAGARVEVIEEKRFPGDFALWKKAKPSEPSWESPFGRGRPGWHTECVAMSLSLLGEGFDLHGGGVDLIFPHHENERAQAVALGKVFAHRWIHNGLVTQSGEKMSKSLGNFTTLAELLETNDARAYRLLVLRAHYRSPLEVTAETLSDASSALSRIDALTRRIAHEPIDSDSATKAPTIQRFVDAMDDDLDTPAALAQLFEGIRLANTLLDSGEKARGAGLGRCVLELFGALGVFPAEDATPEDAASDLAARRDAARIAGDFTLADAMRAELEALGYAVEDTASGTRIRRR
jgi:cysteinyl-tRNA synthetase